MHNELYKFQFEPWQQGRCLLKTGNTRMQVVADISAMKADLAIRKLIKKSRQ